MDEPNRSVADPVDRVGDLVMTSAVAVVTVDRGLGRPVAGGAVAAVAGLVPHGVVHMRSADREAVVDREVLHAMCLRVLEPDVIAVVVMTRVMAFLGNHGSAGGRGDSSAGNAQNQGSDEDGQGTFDQEMPPYSQRSHDGLAMVC